MITYFLLLEFQNKNEKLLDEEERVKFSVFKKRIGNFPLSHEKFISWICHGKKLRGQNTLKHLPTFLQMVLIQTTLRAMLHFIIAQELFKEAH